jgi:hypothetical protein
MKRYVVCIPQKWDNRQVAMPYSVMAESPKQAARMVIAEGRRREYVNGEIAVVEAKAGRLDDYNYFYTLDMLDSPDMLILQSDTRTVLPRANCS